MKVKWVEDLRPMPDQVPAVYDEAVSDPSLIVKQSGEVVGKHRSFGMWYFLVLCDNGRFKEVEVDKVEVIK